MKSFRGVLLDADNTLFDYDRAEREALEETFSAAAADAPRTQTLEAYHEINARFWKRFERGEVDAAGLQSGRWIELFRRMGFAGNPGEAAAAYVSNLSRKAHLLPGARETVEELSRRARLCLVTNGLSAVQRGRLALSGMAACFHAVVISEEIGIAKPDPRFFQAAAAALGLGAEELLCVGDNPAADVAGARGAGIEACWLAPADAQWQGPGGAPEHVIREIAEVLRIVPPSA
jgi:2-haloacid dehalogenase